MLTDGQLAYVVIISIRCLYVVYYQHTLFIIDSWTSLDLLLHVNVIHTGLSTVYGGRHTDHPSIDKNGIEDVSLFVLTSDTSVSCVFVCVCPSDSVCVFVHVYTLCLCASFLGRMKRELRGIHKYS